MGKFILSCILLFVCVHLGFIIVSAGLGAIALAGNAIYWLAQKIFKFS